MDYMVRFAQQPKVSFVRYNALASTAHGSINILSKYSSRGAT